MGNQDFGRQNNSMSPPPLDLTPIGMNTINVTTLPIDLIPVKKNARAYATDTTNMFSEENGKAHVPGDPDPDPSSSDSS